VKYTLRGLCDVSCHIHVATQEYVDASNVHYVYTYLHRANVLVVQLWLCSATKYSASGAMKSK